MIKRIKVVTFKRNKLIGWLTVIKFRYLLNHDLGMSVQEVEKLVAYFKDEKEDKVIKNFIFIVDIV